MKITITVDIHAIKFNQTIVLNLSHLKSIKAIKQIQNTIHPIKSKIGVECSFFYYFFDFKKVNFLLGKKFLPGSSRIRILRFFFSENEYEYEYGYGYVFEGGYEYPSMPGCLLYDCSKNFEVKLLLSCRLNI